MSDARATTQIGRLAPSRRRVAQAAVAVAGLGHRAARALRRSSSWSSCSIRSATASGWRGIRQSYVELVRRPDLRALGRQHARLPDRRHQPQDGDRAVPVRLLRPAARRGSRWLSVLFILPWAVPSIPTILSMRFMLNPEWGVINQLIFRLTGDDGPNWLNDPTLALSMAMLRAHLEVAAVLDADPDRRPAGDPARAVRGGLGRRRDAVAEVPLHHLAVDAARSTSPARSSR